MMLLRKITSPGTSLLSSEVVTTSYLLGVRRVDLLQVNNVEDLAPMENGLGVSKIRKALEDVRPDGMVSRVSVFE